jgi:death-on-curing protein
MLYGQNSREDYVVLNLLHSEVMKDTGDPWGQRDVALTRAAVTRPFRTAFGQEIYPTDYLKAAALLDSIVNRVVFKDGNKRTGLLAAVLYLGQRDKIVSFGRKEGEALTWYVVLEHPKIEEIAEWLQMHTIGRQLAAR